MIDGFITSGLCIREETDIVPLVTPSTVPLDDVGARRLAGSPNLSTFFIKFEVRQFAQRHSVNLNA